MPGLSTDEVFGSGSAAAPVSGLSTEDVFGPSPAAAPSVGSQVKRGVKNVAAVADLGLGIFGQALGVGADIGGRVSALAHGGSSSDATWAGKALRESVPAALTSPISTGLKAFGVDDKGLEDSDVNQLIAKGMGYVSRGGDWVEEKTGRKVLKQDVESLVNTFLFALGGRATAAVVDPRLKAMGEAPRAPLKPGDLQLPDTGPTPDQFKSPVTNPTSAAAIDARLGIQDPKAAAAQRAARQKEVRAAFAEDPAWADYQKIYADSAVKMREIDDARLASVEEAQARRAADLERMDAEAAAEKQAQIEEAYKARDEAFREEARRPALEANEDYLIKMEDSLRAFRRGGKEAGAADPKVLAAIAAVGGGALAGFSLDEDHPGEGALLGGLAGALATRIPFRRVGEVARDVTSPTKAVETFRRLTTLPKDERVRINDPANARDYAIGKDTLEAVRFQKSIIERVPDEARRTAVNSWLDGDKAQKLSPQELAVAKELQGYYSDMKEAATNAGVLEAGLENYAPRVVDFSDGGSKLKAWISERTGGGGMSTSSPFAKARTFPTIKELKAAGFKLKTEDPAVLMGAYADSMSRAIHNANLIREVSSMKDAAGNPLIRSAKDAPRAYVQIDSPQLRGKVVHPDIAPSMKFLFDSHTPGTAMRAFEGFVSATKLVAVMGSLFHATSLLYAHAGSGRIIPKMLAAGVAAGAAFGALSGDAATGAMLGAGAGLAAPGLRLAAKALRGTHPIFEELNTKGLGPNVDYALRSGLEFGVEKHPAVEDTHSGAFKAAMQDLSSFADKTIPGTGKLPRAAIAVTEAFDKYMWARLHTTLKLATFQEKVNQLTENNARAHEAAPEKVKLLSREELGSIAASYTNDMFGGLNWRRIAEGVQSKFGRDVATGLLKPSSRRVAQILLFAPDWTVSTTRAFIQAYGKGSGVKGLLEPRTLADLHRQYLLRSALFYLTAGDGLNYAMSGHHLWENKDWTRLELGDGRTLGFNKHAMEPIHWLTTPAQQAANKLGYVPKEAINQLQGTEYISASGKSPPMDRSAAGRVRHAASGLLPIAAQASSKTGSASATVAGILGAPIYGKTDEQKAEEKRLREERKFMESLGK